MAISLGIYSTFSDIPMELQSVSPCPRAFQPCFSLAALGPGHRLRHCCDVTVHIQKGAMADAFQPHQRIGGKVHRHMPSGVLQGVGAHMIPLSKWSSIPMKSPWKARFGVGSEDDILPSGYVKIAIENGHVY